MKTVWINADDFGLTPGVTLGVCEAVLTGAVAGTTAMVCRPDSEADLGASAHRIAGRVGLHLQLTDGVPRSAPESVPSLVGPDGRFPRTRDGVVRPDPREIEREWEAQLAALRAAGIEPTHLDSHHHIHWLPAVFGVYSELAHRHRLPARGGSPRLAALLRRRGVATSDTFSAEFGEGAISVDELVEVADRACRRAPDGGTVELMSHPGRVDEALRQRSTYVEQREMELAVLCAPELPGRLLEREIVLAGWPAFSEIPAA